MKIKITIVLICLVVAAVAGNLSANYSTTVQIPANSPDAEAQTLTLSDSKELNDGK